MIDPDSGCVIREVAELDELYGSALERSVLKQLDRLDDYCREFIAASPMVVVSTQADGMADSSPRGDVPGFVKVAGDRTLLIPDRRGNNRLDTLRNIVRNPAIGLLFLIPGVNETFRVNGDAVVSRDPALTGKFSMQGKLPRTVIVVTMKEAYIHCSRALVRADLWNPAKHVARNTIPSMGMMLAKHTGGFVEAQAVDDENRERVPLTLY
jgi:PPOX class probable FMN-dependent enzyme